MQMDVSIIIVNWNTRDILRDSLRSIHDQTAKGCYEIIVVDNASSDGSAAMIRHEFPDVRLIANDTNRGYGAAANQGIKIAAGRYVLILNSDIIICDGAVDKTVKYADTHQNAAIVTCQVWQSSNEVQMTCFRFPSVLSAIFSVTGLSKVFKYNRFFGREWMLWWGRNSEQEVDVASGMFLLVRREAMDKVGIMDETFFMYYEETDWCRRFADAGWKILFWPGAKVLHIHGGSQSSQQKAAEMFALQRKSMLLYFRKHHSGLAHLTVRCVLAISFVTKFFVWNTIILLRFIAGKNTLTAQGECLKCRGVVKMCFTGN
jgi:GT2 family glycosyltransferase